MGGRVGRPVKSIIRDRMESIVDGLGVTYGYEIFKVYNDAYEPIELRSIYYHLNKGLNLGVFEEVGVEVVKGKFTWGDVSIRKHYMLGPGAVHTATDELHIIIKTLDLKYQDPKKFVSWDDILKNKVSEFTSQLNSLMKGETVVDKNNLVLLKDKIDREVEWLSKYVDSSKVEKVRNKVINALKK